MQPPVVHRRRGAALALAAASAAAAGTALAAPQTYLLDAAATHAHWELRHFGTSTSRGRFDAVSGSITLDREAHSGSASITIGTASISTGMRLFDGILRGPLLLATEEHPSAYFVASRFTFDGDRPATVSGEFTLRGISRPLTLRALRFACRSGTPVMNGSAEPGLAPGEVCGGDFEGEFLRSEFGINHSLPFVGDAVRLVIQVEGTRR